MLADSAPFDSVFEWVRGFPLDSGDTLRVTDVGGADLGPGGRVAVADKLGHNVLAYAPDGELLASLGRGGTSGLELGMVDDVAFDSNGGLYVAASPPGPATPPQGTPTGQVVHLRPDWTVDDTIQVSGTYFVSWLDVLDDRLIVGLAPQRGAEFDVAEYGLEGSFRRNLHVRSAQADDVPYWGGWWSTSFAASSDLWVVANPLYPLAVYENEGAQVDSLGSAGSDFRAPGRPEPFQFSGPSARRDFAVWRRTFDRITGVFVVRDSLLLVQIESLDPSELAVEKSSYRADVYDMRSRDLRFRAMSLPGRIVFADNTLLIATSDEDGWRVDEYTLRSTAHD